jgi:hypothetical protein
MKKGEQNSGPGDQMVKFYVDRFFKINRASMFPTNSRRLIQERAISNALLISLCGHICHCNASIYSSTQVSKLM